MASVTAAPRGSGPACSPRRATGLAPRRAPHSGRWHTQRTAALEVSQSASLEHPLPGHRVRIQPRRVRPGLDVVETRPLQKALQALRGDPPVVMLLDGGPVGRVEEGHVHYAMPAPTRADPQSVGAP